MCPVGQDVRGLFSDRNAAAQALERLRQAGFSHAHMELAPPTPPAPGAKRLAVPTALAAGTGFEASAELAEVPDHPVESPRSLPGGHGWTVVALTDGSDTEIERAVKILKSHGGDVGPLP